MPASVGLLAFASLTAFFAFALAHQQRETEADCTLEQVGADKLSVKGWWLIGFFALLTFLAAGGAAIVTYCELTGAVHHASSGK